MQLSAGGLAAAIGALAAALPGVARAQDIAPAANAYDATASEPGTLVADSAVLYYQEDADRVRAIEAEAALTWNDANGSVFAGRFTYDSLTGATPNGAIRSRYEQRFQPPLNPEADGGGPLPALGPIDGRTGASGTYVTPAGVLPVDKGFKDHREAVDLSATLPLSPVMKISLGGAMSYETDYTSHSARATLTRDLNGKNTTLSLGVNYERDSVRPFTGIPRPLGDMGSRLIGHARLKQVYSAVAGITQVLTPEWLVQINYSYGHSDGYHTDPYKLIALVDRATGDPFFAVYERRPGERTRHSVYLATKFATGSNVTDASARWYNDSWGITAWTFALSEHVPLGRAAYVEPGVRWYHQGAARFFRHFLYLDEPYPRFTSSDSRLGAFSAWTLALKAGVHISPRVELYGAAERYWQYGPHRDRSLPGYLARTDLFAGSRSVSLIAGARLSFR